MTGAGLAAEAARPHRQNAARHQDRFRRVADRGHGGGEGAPPPTQGWLLPLWERVLQSRPGVYFRLKQARVGRRIPDY